MVDQAFNGAFTVLAVDDDSAALKLVEVLLKNLGAKTVMSADCGMAAFNTLARLTSRIDCIISDLKMPNGNGLQLLKEVRLGRFQLVRPDACFIMLSAISHPLAVKTAAQLDVSAYLIKPISIDSLKAGIAKARSKIFPVDFAKYAAVTVPAAA